MRRWLSALIAGPDGAVDEAALFFCAYAFLGIGALTLMNILIAYLVLCRGEHLNMMEFAQANAILLTAVGSVGGIIQGFIGTRNRLTKQG